MKKLTYSLLMAIVLFTASSFTAVHHQKAAVINNKRFNIHGGFMHDGHFYEVNVNSVNSIITSVRVQNASFSVTSAGGFMGTSGNIHVTIFLSDGTDFTYEGPF